MTFQWDYSSHRSEIHHLIAAWTDAVIQFNKTLFRTLGHAVITSDDDVHFPP